MDDIDEFAFPLKHVGPGMSLRDYFAARAMQGLLFQENYEAKCLSDMAYHIADAMLKERSK